MTNHFISTNGNRIRHRIMPHIVCQFCFRSKRAMTRLLTLAFLLLSTAPAWASIEWRCEKVHQAMADIEADGFHMIGGGVTGNRRGYVAFFIAIDGRWIATMTNTQGMTCIQGRGDGWQGEAPCWGETGS